MKIISTFKVKTHLQITLRRLRVTAISLHAANCTRECLVFSLTRAVLPGVDAVSCCCWRFQIPLVDACEQCLKFNKNNLKSIN